MPDFLKRRKILVKISYKANSNFSFQMKNLIYVLSIINCNIVLIGPRVTAVISTLE